MPLNKEAEARVVLFTSNLCTFSDAFEVVNPINGKPDWVLEAVVLYICVFHVPRDLNRVAHNIATRGILGAVSRNSC